MSNGKDDVTDVAVESVALVRRNSVMLEPVMDVPTAMARLQRFQEFCATYLRPSKDGGADGGDYGIIPGSNGKQVLYKSGAEKLCDVYGMVPTYDIVEKMIDYESGLFDYTIRCTLLSKADDSRIGTGLGSCSSFESKYRWRYQDRACPACGKATIIKGREEYGGGWLCFAKKGGCGAKYADTDPSITKQVLGRIENPDLIDCKNTVLKISKKRSMLDAVIGATRSSGIYTQDLEEFAVDVTVEVVKPAEKAEPTKTESAKKPEAASAETHAEKIARIKREAHEQQGQPEKTVETTVKTVATMPAVIEGETVLTSAPVIVTGINIKQGPMVMKDGKQIPSWGPLYVITFNGQVRVSDGAAVSDAATLDEKVALAAENVMNGDPVCPVIVPGRKKGTYELKAVPKAV